MVKNNGGAAFPRPASVAPRVADVQSQDGMTLRDYFAAKALPLAMEDYRLCIDSVNRELPEWHFRGDLSCVAGRAYELADAMLLERERR